MPGVSVVVDCGGKKRKLRTTLSLEAVKNLREQHGVEAEKIVLGTFLDVIKEELMKDDTVTLDTLTSMTFVKGQTEDKEAGR